jgi:hypothetical protein
MIQTIMNVVLDIIYLKLIFSMMMVKSTKTEVIYLFFNKLYNNNNHNFRLIQGANEI